MLLVSAPLWVRLVSRLVQASWWEGPVPAHSWLELSLAPLVSRAISRGMSRGGCGIRKSLGCLSVDEWDCVPAMLVGWPKASQHSSLQAVRWGQVLVLMLQARCQLSDEYSWICLLPSFMSHSCHRATVSPPPPQETLQDQQVGLVQAPMKSLLCPGSWCT